MRVEVFCAAIEKVPGSGEESELTFGGAGTWIRII